MGMDIYGRQPRSEAGAYFRNNNRSWAPLANYCCDIAPEITRACNQRHRDEADGGRNAEGEQGPHRSHHLDQEEVAVTQTRDTCAHPPLPSPTSRSANVIAAGLATSPALLRASPTSGCCDHASRGPALASRSLRDWFCSGCTNDPRAITIKSPDLETREDQCRSLLAR